MATLNGFIKIHRQMLEWGWYKDANTKALFLHLLLVASFKDAEYMGYKIKPGQAVVGYKALSEQLGLSVQQLRTAMKHLEQTGEISKKVTSKFTIVTIENWASYQLEDVEATSNQQATNKQLTSNQQHLKNVKNVKNNNAFGKTIIEPPKYPKFKAEEPVKREVMPEEMRRKFNLV